MGSMNIKLKIMPESPDVNLEELREKITKTVEENQGKGISFEEQPIAFGLKALITVFILPEDSEPEQLENKISEIEKIGSVEVEDMRRAI